MEGLPSDVLAHTEPPWLSLCAGKVAAQRGNLSWAPWTTPGPFRSSRVPRWRNLFHNSDLVKFNALGAGSAIFDTLPVLLRMPMVLLGLCRYSAVLPACHRHVRHPYPPKIPVFPKQILNHVKGLHCVSEWLCSLCGDVFGISSTHENIWHPACEAIHWEKKKCVHFKFEKKNVFIVKSKEASSRSELKWGWLWGWDSALLLDHSGVTMWKCIYRSKLKLRLTSSLVKIEITSWEASFTLEQDSMPRKWC